MTRLIFNNKVYTFSNKNLKSIFDSMIINESVPNGNRKYVLSFIENKIVKKAYDELDYHEFIIETSFRFSQLLCNIDNVFGKEATVEFAKEINSISGEETSWDSTNFSESISANEAIKIWESLSNPYSKQLGQFQELLSLLYLYGMVRFDYMQTITNFDDLGTIEFINGIVVQKKEYKGCLFLKPVANYYETEIENCRKICNIYLPPIVLNAIICTFHNIPFVNKESDICIDYSVVHKLEQLTGSVPEYKDLSVPVDAKKDDSIIGKWYIFEQTENDPFSGDAGRLYTYLFDSNGKHKRSWQIGFGVPREDWGSLEWDWYTDGNDLHIISKKHNQHEIWTYKIEETKLYINKSIYYKYAQDAINNPE